MDEQGPELTNFSGDQNLDVDEIEKLLGYVDEPELIHRDNMILV